MSKLFDNEMERRMAAGESEAYHSPEGQAYRDEFVRVEKLVTEFFEPLGVSFVHSAILHQVAFGMHVLEAERKRLKAINTGF